MKKLLFIAFIAMFSMSVFAGSVTVIGKTSIAPLKKIDITVQSGGYTIHIYGTATYSIVNGTVSINATITITGPGTSITLPYVYSGSLNASKGAYTNPYSDKGISDDDKPTVELIMSHIYLPTDNDAKKIKIE